MSSASSLETAESGVVTAEPSLEDARAPGVVQRLLEDSWASRLRLVGRSEQLVEATSSLLFLAIAVPLAWAALGAHALDWQLAVVLVLMHALCSRFVSFPIGAGYVVPSYLVLVPMLLLLPVGAVPLLVAASMALGTAAEAVMGRTQPQRVLLAVSDSWHALGPAVVLLIAGTHHSGAELALIYAAAFFAGCLVDLVSATVREATIAGVDSRVQLRVVAVVWLVDACIAPLGLLVAHAAQHNPAEVLLIVPLNGVLILMARERNARIEQAQQRLDLVGRERKRLQTAVRRLGEALAARLDLDSLLDVVLRGCVEAMDADAGRFVMCGPSASRALEVSGPRHVAELVAAAASQALDSGRPAQPERDGVYALALPFTVSSAAGQTSAALAVARDSRAFRADEQEVMRGLLERARHATTEIVAHQTLREQALTDALTGLGNRRKLAGDVKDGLGGAAASKPLVLILFDLDGFKSYNDTFGHGAGDAMLTRLGGKLATSVARHGAAYRLGGDEFCVLAAVEPGELYAVVSAAAAALTEQGEDFAVQASYGAVLLPHEASTLDYALQLADERMYSRKRGRPSSAGDQARDVLLRIMHAKQPTLDGHASDVAQLCIRVGQRMQMSAEELDELARAAELHDIGKVGVPDAILDKPAALDEVEWEFIRQHTVLGERILSAAPALRPVAVIVRSSHERWDGGGYPDGLAGSQIPLGARIVAACDAYDAITTDRIYRKGRDHEAACRELREQAGAQFDPDVVEALLADLRESPPGPAPQAAADEPDARASAAEEVVAQLREALMRHIVPELGAHDASAADAAVALEEALRGAARGDVLIAPELAEALGEHAEAWMAQ
jgi:diguanylate cyclase (GGDEF)-like protein